MMIAYLGIVYDVEASEEQTGIQSNHEQEDSAKLG